MADLYDRPMLNRLLMFLPDATPDVAGWALLLAMLAGALAWGAGVIVARPAMTLILVALGAWLGRELPGWFGWQIDASATCVVGAIVLGIAGYLRHVWFIGLMAGLCASLWAVAATLLYKQATVAFSGWPDTPWAYAAALWHAMPSDVARLVAVTTMLALAATTTLVQIFPRWGVRLAWSVTGLTVLTAVALLAVRYDVGGKWSLPGGSMQVEAGCTALLVLVGMGVQSKLSGMTASSGESPAPKADSPAEDSPKPEAAAEA